MLLLQLLSLYAVTVTSYSPMDVMDERNMALMNAPENISLADRIIPVIVAGFGRQLNGTTIFNLMLPPTDDTSNLCTLPPSIARGKTEEIGFDEYSAAPIALYVSELGCTAEQKAAVVTEINSIMGSVKYLIIKETEPNDPSSSNDTMPQSSSIFDTSLGEPSTNEDDGTATIPLQFDQLGIIFVTAEAARMLDSDLDAVKNLSSRVSPHFLDDNSIDWTFRLRIEGLSDSNGNLDDDWRDDPRGKFHPASENYYMLRGVLFGLLIAAPCFRAAFLWYAGGGRLHWRRNEEGRIVGIQHIPPIPYWLALGRPPSSREVRVTLTEEQFARLPEIKYYPDQVAITNSTSPENDIRPNDVACPDPHEESDGSSPTVCESDDSERQACQSDRVALDPSASVSDPTRTQPALNVHEGVGVDDECNTQSDSDTHVRVATCSIGTVCREQGTKVTTPRKREKDLEKQVVSPDVSMDESDTDNHPAPLVDDDDDGPDGDNDCAVHVLDMNPVAAVAAAAPAHNESSDDENETQSPVTAPQSTSATSSATLEPPVTDENDGGDQDGISEMARACTTCSICIEDFIPGETLILLPRCKHAFHRDCIHPWLLERQGCCPTCKTTALPAENDDSNTTE